MDNEWTHVLPIDEKLSRKMQETSIIDITKAIDRVCGVVDDEDKLELILNEYKSTYNLSKKDFIDYFPLTRQDTDNALYFFLLTHFHKIVKLALMNKTSLLPFHEVLTIYVRQFAHALEKFDETRGFSYWTYAKWYEYAANSEIKRICEKQSIVSPIENE